jgi:protein translocase SecG subunit
MLPAVAQLGGCPCGTLVQEVKVLQNALNIIVILLSATLVTVVILQSKGSGFGGIFGGRDMMNPLHTRRGLEKTLFVFTIGLAVAFLFFSLISSLVSA